jgi:glutathione S-transferase
MDKLSLQNPVFATYAIAVTIMILKAVGMSWLTVVRMMQVKGGFRSPEDIKKTALNPDPIRSSLSPTSVSSEFAEFI